MMLFYIIGGSMKFCLNISLSLFDKDSPQDFYRLSELFDDCSLSEFIEDNAFAKYIYFIKENDTIIGFVYLMQYIDSDIYNLEYGIKIKQLNEDYVYTVLTLIRDKIKGIHATKEIQNLTIVSSVLKTCTYNSIACLFGNLLYSNELYNFYEINPNCEDLEEEKQKIMHFLNTKKF